MRSISPLGHEEYDKATTDPDGYRDKRGEWRPAEAVAYAPIFVRPEKLIQFLQWLKDYLLKWNLFFFAITAVTWLYFQPSLETCATFRPGWIAQMFVRNLVLLWIIFGGWHLYLYTFKERGYRGKYSPRWQSTNGATFLFNNQVHDNIFWASGSGCITWTAYEVVTMWMYANHYIPYIDFKTSPAWFVGWFLLIPFWREFHFYWIHRLIHWKPLYDRIHYLHHYNINPGPWSGMAMHPLEHLFYFSVTLIHWIVPSHPLHFLYNAQHTALTPAAGHTGFEGELTEQINFGSYFHYLHHRHFDCNYGEATIPLDKWFGSFEDGSRTDSEKSEGRRTYHRYTVVRIAEESPEVKSFYLKRSDGAGLESYAPGQHLMFKVPVGEGKSALRFYTLSDVDGDECYRISVKREGSPPGIVSTYLHDQLAAGDSLEARGPLGDFVPNLHSRRPMILITGGIGITPILSMLKGCLRQHPHRKISLFLAFRDPQRRVFEQEIKDVLSRHPQVQCFTFFDEVKPEDVAEDPNCFAERISVERIKERLPVLRGECYICGPGPMMEACIEGLMRAGVPEHRIHTESFNQGPQAGGPGAATGQQFEVRFTRSDKTLLWDPEFNNLLEFAESNDIAMDAGCMFGECGACMAKLNEGEVEYNYVTATKPREGHCLPCSCRPKTQLSIDA